MVFQKTPLACLAILLVACSPGCIPEEEAPLADGLYFKYQWKVVTDVLYINIKVKETDGEHFLLQIKSTKRGVKKPANAEVRVDRFFKMDSGKPAGVAGRPFWLPSYKRKPGGKVAEDGSIRIRKEKKWEGWDVWVAGGSVPIGSVEWYYEKETGFFVGSRAESMGSGMSMKLLKTNAPGLK